jgi:hypothetical protein
MKPLFLFFFLLAATVSTVAQELKCKVQVNSNMVQGTNKQIFSTLEKAISDLMNTRQWSNATYAPNERVECNINIIIKTYANDIFSGEIQVQARRPIYNSSYFSSLFNSRDQNFTFTYIESQPLETNDQQISNNLIAVLFYYGYVVLGYDADSFSRFGGTPFFRRAEEITNAMQSATEPGWKAFESDRNRYALINGILDERLQPLRELNYEYHRLGLDVMADNVDNGRAKIAEALPMLKNANDELPSNIAITTFLDSKLDEIADIFSKGLPKEKSDVYDLLMNVVPSMQKRFEKIQTGQ